MEVHNNALRISESGPLPATPSFYERHHSDLSLLFDMVGVPAKAASSLDMAVAFTQPWVKGDHSRPESQVIVDPVYNGELRSLYARFGQIDEVILPPGDYHEIIIPGAVQRGNRRRVGLLQRVIQNDRFGVTTGHATLLGGERHLFPEVEKTDIEETLATIDKQGIRDTWTQSIRHTSVDELWETDGLRLAALEKLGPLVLEKLNLRPHNQSDFSGNGLLLGYEFTSKDVSLSLMHTLAVDRPNGERRHTTVSCIQEWLQYRQPPEGALIGFIGANPHLERMGRATVATLRTEGRGDLQLVVAGPAAVPGLGHGHYLGEIARNLYEDQRDARLIA